MVAPLGKKAANTGAVIRETFRVPNPEAQNGFDTVERFFVFEMTSSESHETNIEWTSQPIEDGTQISDHGVEQQFRLSVTGMVTASPLYAPLIQEERLANSALTLREMARAKRLIEVSTSLATYGDVVISGVNIPRKSDDGQAYEASLTFVQLEIIESASIEVPADILRPDLRAGGASKGSAGRQNGDDDDADDPESAAGKSAAATRTSLAKQGFTFMQGF